MTPAPPLPQEVWDATPPEARAFIAAVLLQVEALRAEVAALKARLDANSQNPSRPPSSDPPHVKRHPPRSTTNRRRGGQPGHKRAVRPMVPPERLAQVVECVPTACPRGAALAGTDPAPHAHQVAELPEVRPDVVQYRPHRLTSPAAGRPHRRLRPAPPGDLRPADGPLPPRQAPGPGGPLGSAGPVGDHRHGQQGRARSRSCFSKLKAALRSAAARPVDARIEAMGEALRAARAGDIRGRFGHCGSERSESTARAEEKPV